MTNLTDIDGQIAKLKERRQKLIELRMLEDDVKCLESGDYIFPNATALFTAVTDSVCVQFAVTKKEIYSRVRTDQIAIPRQVIFYLLKQIEPHLTEIAIARFFNKDHGTISYGISAVKDRMETDSRFKIVVEACLTASMAKLHEAKKLGEYPLTASK